MTQKRPRTFDYAKNFTRYDSLDEFNKLQAHDYQGALPTTTTAQEKVHVPVPNSVPVPVVTDNSATLQQSQSS